MANVHGQRSAAGIRVDEDVFFLRNVITRYSNPWSKSYFVDGTNGVDTNSGQTPTDPFKTIQKAVTTSSRGDTIFVRPLAYTTDASDVNRYIEAVTVPYATADLSLVGVSRTNPGNPNYGAKLQWTTADGSYALKVNAPAFHVENMCVRAEGATGGVHFYGYANDNYAAYGGSCGPTMYNCVVRGGGIGVKVENGYASVISNCRFEGGAAQNNSYYLTGAQGPARRHVVRECYFGGTNGAAIAEAYIRILGTCTDMLIQRNVFGIIPTDTHFINATGSNLGLIVENWFDSADITLSTGIVKGGLTLVGAYDATMVVPAG